MSKLLPTLLFLLLEFLSFGQTTQIDSLQNAAAQQKGLHKVRTLNHLAGNLIPHDIEKAQGVVDEAYKLACKLNDYSGQAQSLGQFGALYMSRFDYTQAMNAYLEALKIYDELGDKKGQAQTRNQTGRVYFLRADYVQSEQQLLKALELWKEIKDITGESEGYNLLGMVYAGKKDFRQAKDFFRKALDIKMAAGDAAGSAKIAQELGKLSLQTGDYAQALAYYKTSLEASRKQRNLLEVGKIESQLAQILLAQRLPEDALAANNNAYKIHSEEKDTLGMAGNLSIFAEIEMAQGNTKQAESFYDRSFALLKDRQPALGSPEIIRDISSGYSKLKLFEKALEAQTVYAASKDVVFDLEKSRALMELTMRYESEFAAKEQLQKIERLESDKSSDRMVRSFLFLLILVIGTLVVSLYLSNKRSKKDNVLLVEKMEENNRQQNEINTKNLELKQKNQSLDLLNKKLLKEIAEREYIEKSSFARDRFLATMSHQMRTPLNVIVGMTHILLDSRLTSDQEESLRALQFSANDLVVFINDVLDFSKIEAGKLNIEDRGFHPAKLFNGLFERFANSAQETGTGFSGKFDQSVPAKLWGDSTRVTQILTNLFKHVLQEGGQGSVNIEVCLKDIYPKEALLEISVENNFCQIEPAALENLIKARHDWEDLNGYGSHHLSLVICKRLIELQKGKLTVEQNGEKGIRFKALMPFKMMPGANLTGEKQHPADAGYAHLEGSRILVVEDNKINQLVVSKLLRNLKMEVFTANNGLEALEEFEQRQFDLVLMDIQMPEMDGYRATSEIRRHPDELKRDVPIIALTASAFLTEKEKAKLFGMNDHIAKPFSPEELLEKINSCLEFCKNV